MANVNKWIAGASPPGAPTTLFTSELNTLTNVTFSIVAGTVDNSANLDLYADFEMFLNTLTPTAGGYCALFCQTAPDGTNYESSGSTAYVNQIVASWALDTANSTKRLTIRNVLLPPEKLRFQFYNAAGASLNGASNTVKIVTYNLNNNA